MRGERLAGARLAHHGDDLAGVDGEVDAAHDLEHPSTSYTGRSLDPQQLAVTGAAATRSSAAPPRVHGGAQPVAEQVAGRSPRPRSRSPGTAIVHQATSSRLRASDTIAPRLGSGGWVPSPRNDSADSVRIAQDSASATCTTIGAATFGSTCRQQDPPGRRSPSTRAGLDVLRGGDRQRRTAGDPDEDRRVDDRDRDRGGGPTAAERGHDRQREQDRREREQHVGEAGRRPGRPSRRRSRRRCPTTEPMTAASATASTATRSDVASPTSVRDGDVAAELVGAEPVLRRRPAAAGRSGAARPGRAASGRRPQPAQQRPAPTTISQRRSARCGRANHRAAGRQPAGRGRGPRAG